MFSIPNSGFNAQHLDIFNQTAFEEDDDQQGWQIDDHLSSEDERDIDHNEEEIPEFFKDYNLRKGVRNTISSQHVSYYDDDASGTFDPNKEKQKLRKVKSGKRNRKFKSCTACRLSETECSLKSWSDKGPCESCTKDGTTCDFVSLQDARSLRLHQLCAPGSDNFEDSSSSLTCHSESDSSGSFTDADIDLDDDIDWTIPEQTLQTGLSHPITFFTSPDNCQWCQDAAYGITRPRIQQDVRVRTSKTGLSYHELSGGNRRAGVKASRMCILCASKRIKIHLCPGHAITKIIVKVRPQKEDTLIKHYKAAVRRLHKNKPIKRDIWCSFCMNLAQYSCQRQLEKSQFGKASCGCGFHLCQFCFEGIKELGGNVGKYLDNLLDPDRDKSKYFFSPRPDAELLKAKSLLFKNLQCYQK